MLNDSLPQPDHLCIAQLHGQKAAQRPANRDTNEEQAGKAGRCLCGNLLLQNQITAGPQARGLLCGAVAKECDHNRFCPGDTEDLG